jgi:hypothetical protein
MRPFRERGPHTWSCPKCGTVRLGADGNADWSHVPQTVNIGLGRAPAPVYYRDVSVPRSALEPWRARLEQNHRRALENISDLSAIELWMAAHDSPLFGPVDSRGRMPHQDTYPSPHEAERWFVDWAASL